MAAMFGGNTSTTCYIPLTTAQDFNHSRNYANLSIVSKVGVDSEDLARRIENYLNGFYRSNQYFEKYDALRLTGASEAQKAAHEIPG